MQYASLYPVMYCVIRYYNPGLLHAGLTKRLLRRLKVDRFENVFALVVSEESGSASASASAAAACGDQSAAANGGSSESAAKEEGGGEKWTVMSIFKSRKSVRNTISAADRLCPICLMDIANRENIYVMPCDKRHFFHQKCLEKWFERNSVCPICRVNIADVSRCEPLTLRITGCSTCHHVQSHVTKSHTLF
ncbi:zinc finger, C3HC4 type (RING finger) domain-containing protein [Babesia caballi]|uniref:RING-type E3 ubiquitin transferase n=1 Tax=Babesia caballi TaxID=5871 RepID=A0AAV4LU33_BABCB|nr:zinc finger, C3HC4 type (RING finger) domain-containing protein [Babesia caballi]